MTSAREGYVDPSGVVHAYARAAKNRGAEIIEVEHIQVPINATGARVRIA